MAGGIDIRVTGAEQMRALGRDLRAAGSEGAGLRRELLAGMRALGKPLVQKTRASAEATLPKRGGLNVWVGSGADIRVRNNLTGSARVGMKIVATHGAASVYSVDGGTARHPVFGHRDRWSSNPVTPGWFTKPLNESVPEVQAMLLITMRLISERIERG